MPKTTAEIMKGSVRNVVTTTLTYHSGGVRQILDFDPIHLSFWTICRRSGKVELFVSNENGSQWDFSMSPQERVPDLIRKVMEKFKDWHGGETTPEWNRAMSRAIRYVIANPTSIPGPGLFEKKP